MTILADMTTAFSVSYNFNKLRENVNTETGAAEENVSKFTYLGSKITADGREFGSI